MSSSTSSSPTSPTRTALATPSSNWQVKLLEECRAQNLPTPIYNLVSDMRGGRTAWSAIVIVGGVPVTGRYWYDGDFVNNAREDAAEVALAIIQRPQSQHPQIFPQTPQVLPYPMQF